MIIPVITNNSSNFNEPIPEWMNITFGILINIVLVGVFILITGFIIEIFYDDDKIFAIIMGLIIYPLLLILFIIVNSLIF